MQSLIQAPNFAIVGHPNKGKSSIVATLAHDDSVVISPISGTTQKNRSYPMSIDGKVLYQLIDTPGFQRARQVIAWLQQHSKTSADRRDCVIEFIQRHESDAKFTAECELLKPIIAGAGILYVVDGSAPYGPEYDAEMEILRWTGSPSMALINPIHNENYIDEWHNALSQYFKIVRVFNAHTADIEKQLQLLSGFAQLNETWHNPLTEAVTRLETREKDRLTQSCYLISEMMGQVLHFKLSQSQSDDDTEQQKDRLTEDYKNAIRTLESRCRSHVESQYNYRKLAVYESALQELDVDLFAQSGWQIFGLSDDQLMTVGVIGGAAAGGAVDVALGGTSLLLGSGIGAVIGGFASRFGSKTLAQVKVIGMPLGRKQLTIGPSKNINLPFVLTARALYHLQAIHTRTHSRQDDIKLTVDKLFWHNLGSDTRAEYNKLFNRLRKDNTKDHAEALAEQLYQTITSTNVAQLERKD